MPKYSIIVPVYNRPNEIDELLDSLTKQVFSDFEVLVIEDGSDNDCKRIVESYQEKIDVKYFFKENSGQGFSRNYGYERAGGSWLLVFDSDCIIPENYLVEVEVFLSKNKIDAFGGPDRAHPDFTPVQKAISYAMTSPFTTGGIRGNKKHVGVFHPRSFNMGITKEVFEKTSGYILPRKGEDIEFSIRIINNGFKTALIPDAFVYHKRRTNFRQFFKQLHFFGTARINIYRYFKSELKVVHLFPALFTLGWISSLIFLLLIPMLGMLGVIAYSLFFLLIFFHATLASKSLKVGLLSMVAAFTQLTAYGFGFINEAFIYLKKG